MLYLVEAFLNSISLECGVLKAILNGKLFLLVLLYTAAVPRGIEQV